MGAQRRRGGRVIATHIDLGLPEAAVLDLGPLKAALPRPDAFDAAFGEGFL